MKKLIAGLIIITLLMVCMVPMSFAQETPFTRAEAVERIVSALYYAGGESVFSLETDYCFHPGDGGYAHFEPGWDLTVEDYPVLCEVYATTEGTGFSDITLADGQMTVTIGEAISITLAKAMGIINGCGGGAFQPNRAVTYDEAVKLIVCAAGYGFMGEALGGYPAGYQAAAAELGITKDIDLMGADMVDASIFDTMLAHIPTSPKLMIMGMTDLFTPPESELECAEIFAEAVKNRNGAMQYALLSDELKYELRAGFESFGWITGASSPWIADYDIEETGEAEFVITFRYESSTGPFGEESMSLAIGIFAPGVLRISEIDI